jgi:hypothetical protein
MWAGTEQPARWWQLREGKRPSPPRGYYYGSALWNPPTNPPTEVRHALVRNGKWGTRHPESVDLGCPMRSIGGLPDLALGSKRYCHPTPRRGQDTSLDLYYVIVDEPCLRFAEIWGHSGNGWPRKRILSAPVHMV